MINPLSPPRLASASARNPWRVITIWAALLVASIAIIATMLAGVLTTEQGFTGTPESQQAAALIAARAHAPAAVVETIVVHAPAGVTDPRTKRAVVALAAGVEALGPTVVSSVVTPFAGGDRSLVSADGTDILVPVAMAGTLKQAQDSVDQVLAVVAAANTPTLTAHMTGQASIAHDINATSQTDLSTGESIGIPVALLILLLVFGALVSALLPLMLSIVAIVVSLALTAIVGEFYSLSFFVTNMITMMGLAVGIDYVLFIVSRFREERAAGLDKLAAIDRTGETASRAVFFSGVTVIVALLGMLIVPTSIFVSLGAGAILVVLSAIAAALTLVPAVLSLLGDRIERGSVGRLVPSGLRRMRTGGFWGRAVTGVMRRPIVSLLVTAGLLGFAAIPYLSISTGTAGVSTLPSSLPSRQAYDVLQSRFSVGRIAPADIPVTGPDEARQIATAITGDPRYGTPALVNGVLEIPINLDPNSLAAVDAIRHLRTVSTTPVGGSTSMSVDYFDIVDTYLPIVFAIVLALSFLVLLVAFRSIVVPFVAIAMNLLSVGAAYGVLVFVMQQGHLAGLFGFQQVPTIEAWLPLFLFSVLFGLSMDYHVFLLSRIRERWLATGDVEDSITFGITSSARLITGAALIMVAVFGGFAAGQLVMFQQMGFGLAVAVLLDATLVRTILVPATMKLLGRRNWYLPRGLHWLPTISIEGDLGGREPVATRP